jgi:hypothetical protein
LILTNGESRSRSSPRPPVPSFPGFFRIFPWIARWNQRFTLHVRVPNARSSGRLAATREKEEINGTAVYFAPKDAKQDATYPPLPRLPLLLPLVSFRFSLRGIVPTFHLEGGRGRGDRGRKVEVGLVLATGIFLLLRAGRF